MIDRSSFEPLYIQVKNDIIADIKNGKICVGDKLMSENEMLRYYGVGRMTIRAALSELMTEKLVKKFIIKPVKLCAVCQFLFNIKYVII